MKKSSKLGRKGNTPRFGFVSYDKAERQTTLMLWDGNRQIQEYTKDHVFMTVYEQDSFVPVARVVWLQPNALEQAKQDEQKIWKEVSKDPYPNPTFKKRLEHQSQQGIRIYHYHTDHLGTPQELTNALGEVVWLNYSQAWGGSYDKQCFVKELDNLDVSADVLQPLRFQGQFFDGETGFHYNRFRYYDSDVGMFISRDPIGLFGGDNVFQYTPNPIGWIDPYGLAKTKKKNTLPTECSCDAIDPCADNQIISWTNHKYKHVPSSSVEWKEIVKSTKNGGEAKYKHGINIEKLERQAWAEGTKVSTPTAKNVVYKVFQADYIIGANNGKETNLMRIECSQGVIHGHPILPNEYKRLTKR